MAEELISEYVDRNGVKGDTEFILSSLREVYGEFKKIEGVKIDLKGFAGLAGINPAMQQAKAGMEALATTTDTVTKRVAQMNGQSKEFTQVLLLQAKAEKELASAQNIRNKSGQTTSAQLAKEKKAVDDATNDYYQLSKAYNEAALKAKNYQIVLGHQHPIALAAVKDANDLGNVLKKLDASVGQNQRNVGNYASAFNGLGFSFTQVARELPSLSVNFQQFALAISNNLPMVADEISRAKREIAALKAEGKDAPSLFNRIGKSIFSWQVGLSVGITLFTLFSKQIGAFFKSLFTGSKAFDEAKAKTKAFIDALKELNTLSIKGSIADTTKLELYRDILNDTTRSQKERNEALKGYNAIADDSNKLDASQLSNLTLINDKISEQITLIEKRALSRAAESILADKAEAFLLARESVRLQVEKEITQEEENGLVIYNNKVGKSSEFAKIERRAAIESRINSNEKVKQAKIEFDAAKSALYGQIQVAGFVSDEIKKKREKSIEDYGKDSAKIQAEITKAEFEALKQRRQNELDALKIIASDEENFYAERVEATISYFDKAQELIDLNTQYEIKAQADVIEEEKRQINLKLANKDLTAKQRSDLNDQLLLLVKKQTADENLIKEKAHAEELKQTEERENQLTALITAELQRREDHRRAFHEINMQDIQNQYDEANNRLDRRFQQGLISERKYNERKLLLQVNLQAAILKEDIEFTKSTIELAQARAEASGKQEDIDRVVSAKKKLAALEIDLASLVTAFQIKKNKEFLDSAKDVLEGIASISQQVFDIIGGFVAAGVEREKNMIQEQIDMLEKKKEKDIEVANQTIVNAEEKAAAIAVIEARAAAQREALERKQRQAQERQAKFEKAATIANIVITTALAVVRALAAPPGPPATIPQAIIAGAIGAAQLASAIATPIPRYKHGKNAHDDYEGPAIVGDGGKKEAIIREDGTVEITDDKPQLTHVGKRDVVLPDANMLINYVLSGHMGGRLSAGNSKPESDSVEKAVQRMEKNIVKAIQNKQELHVHNSERGMAMLIQHAQNTTNYINNNCNW